MPSKKRSAASASPPSFALLLDENLQGPKIFAPLRAAGLPVERLQDHFKRGIPDEDLLRGLSRHPRWFLVTKDERMRYRPAVVEIMRESGLGIFVLTATKDLTGEQLAAVLAGAWRRLQVYIAETPPPFVAAIGATGSVKTLRGRP